MANTKKNYTHGERRGVFEIREYENTAHVRVVTFISYTDVIYIYIYTLSYFKKIKKDAQPQKIRARSESYITKNKSGTIYLLPPPYYIEINKKNT